MAGGGCPSAPVAAKIDRMIRGEDEVDIVQLEHFIRFLPEDWRTRHFLGIVKFKEQDFQMAVSMFRNARDIINSRLEQNPEDPWLFQRFIEVETDLAEAEAALGT